MMNEVVTPSDIYWMTRMDNICTAAGFFVAISGVATVGLGLIGASMKEAITYRSGVEKPDNESRAIGALLHRQLRWVVPVFVVSVLAAILVPTTKEAIAIVVIPKIANNESVQGIGEDLVNTAREWIEELRPQNNNKEKSK